MSARETLGTAFGGILANKLRSGLTMLGLCIGVAAVIALVAVGNGSKKQVQSSIDALGTNILQVSAQAGGFGPGASSGSGVTLSQQDASALVDAFDAPDVKSASPAVQAQGATLTAGETSYSPSSFVGTTPTYSKAKDITIAQGSAFTAADVKDHARKVVLGSTVVQNLFPSTSPIGQSVRVNGTTFTVVGVAKSKGSNGADAQTTSSSRPSPPSRTRSAATAL